VWTTDVRSTTAKSKDLCYAPQAAGTSTSVRDSPVAPRVRNQLDRSRNTSAGDRVFGMDNDSGVAMVPAPIVIADGRPQ
jgi:hypothetical protein